MTNKPKQKKKESNRADDCEKLSEESPCLAEIIR